MNSWTKWLVRIYNVIQSVVVLTLTNNPVVPASFGWPDVFDLPYDMTTCSKLILYMFYPRPEISPSPRLSGYFSRNMVFRDHNLGARVLIVLGWALFLRLSNRRR